MVIKPGSLTVGKAIWVMVLIMLLAIVYVWLIWFFLAGFGWKAALALGLAIPAMGVLVAAVWYLYASGLYRVIRDMQKKAAYEKKLKRMLKRAMAQMLEETLAEKGPAATELAPQEQRKV